MRSDDKKHCIKKRKLFTLLQLLVIYKMYVPGYAVFIFNNGKNYLFLGHRLNHMVVHLAKNFLLCIMLLLNSDRESTYVQVGKKVVLATEGHKIKFLLMKFQRCPNVLK